MVDLRQNAEARSILERDGEYLLPVYARYPVVMDRGEGVYLFDSSGNRYLDLMAGLGVNALGHAHPRMVAAMADQATRIVHLSPQYASRYPGELGERLCAMSGMKGVFYSTGGSEAVEGALKLARTHARQNYRHPKHGIVALKNSYHGRTYGSLSVTGQDKYRLDFGPGLPDVTFVERENFAQLRAAVSAHFRMGQQIAGLVVRQQARWEQWQQRLIGGAVRCWHRVGHRRFPPCGSRIGRCWERLGWLEAWLCAL